MEYYMGFPLIKMFNGQKYRLRTYDVVKYSKKGIEAFKVTHKSKYVRQVKVGKLYGLYGR